MISLFQSKPKFSLENVVKALEINVNVSEPIHVKNLTPKAPTSENFPFEKISLCTSFKEVPRFHIFYIVLIPPK